MTSVAQGSSDLVVVGAMAEDESRTEKSSTVNNNEAPAGGSSSKDIVQDDDDEGWLHLQLGIGSQMTSHDHEYNINPSIPAISSGNLIELDLLPGSSTSTQQDEQVIRSLGPMFHVPAPDHYHHQFQASRPVTNTAAATNYSSSTSASLLLQQAAASGTSSTYPHHQEINWGFGPIPIPRNITSAPASSSLMRRGSGSYSYFTAPRPFDQLHDTLGGSPSLDFRPVDPPRRPHSGIWFMLQASQNQTKEPILPQIPKSYLRIKDGGMTVRLLMKYLVNKLRLENESQIEITCRGQRLLPFLTLQHVRDNIWSPRDALTLLPHSSTTHHVMLLQYARTA